MDPNSSTNTPLDTTGPAGIGSVQSQGDISFTFNNLGYFEGDDVDDVARAFVGRRIFTNQQETDIHRLFMFEQAVIDRLVDELDRRRVLLLTGERAIGKMTTALYVATRIADRHDLPRCTLIVDPLDRNAPLDIRKIAETQKRYGHRTTLFVDAFDRDNRDLLRFFGELDRTGAEQLAETLRKNGSYLLVTACSGHLSSLPRSESLAVAHYELLPPGEILIEEGLNRKLAFLVEQNPARAGRARLLAEERETLVAALRTLPAVASFAETFVDGTEELPISLRRFKDIRAWLHIVARDFDAWCFVLALTIAHPTPAAESIPWLDFDVLRRRLAEHLRADEDLVPPEFPFRNAGASENAHANFSFVDDALFDKCRAEAVKDSNLVGDVVRFIDRDLPARMWTTLLTHNRRVLTSIVPLLQKIADRRLPARAGLRAVITQALGRIGEIDPLRVTIRLMREWAESGDKNDRPLVGRLVQGALASSNQRYIEAAINEIDTLADPSTAQNADAAKDRLLTAISAYSQIGAYDADYAMTRLGTIAIAQIAPMVHNINVLNRLAETDHRRAGSAQYAGRAAALRARRDGLAAFAHALSAEHAPLAMALEKAIVYVSLVDDPVHTLTATREWISRGGTATGVLLAVLFFHPGIASDLQAVVVETEDGTIVSRLLFSLASGSDGFEQFAAFLADLRTSLANTSSLSLTLQELFRQRFDRLLTSLVVESLMSAHYRDVVADFLVELASVRGRVLRAEIYALLGTDRFREKGSMHAFAIGVRKRISA